MPKIATIEIEGKRGIERTAEKETKIESKSTKKKRKQKQK
jgi:hypothetical protein